MGEVNTVELINRISGASSLQEIADLSFELFGNPIFFVDNTGNVLSYTKGVCITDPSWREIEENQYLNQRRIWNGEEVRSVNAKSVEKQESVLVHDNYIPFPRLIKALVGRGWNRGSMILTAFIRPFGEQDATLLDIISSFAIFLMESDIHQLGAHPSSITNYFIKLLDGAAYSDERVNKRLDSFLHSRKKYFFVLTIELQHLNNVDDDSLEPVVLGFEKFDCCYMFMYDYALVCIYGSNQNIYDWEKQEPKLYNHLCQWSLSAGVSRRFLGLADLRTHYLQAKNARQIGTLLRRDGHVFTYDDYAFYELLQSLPPACILQNYCSQKILHLDQYDKEKNTELCLTLQIYLDSGKNLNRTAEIMFLNRNTIRYRIRKCIEFLETDLDNETTNFSFVLSFRLLEYARKLADTLSKPEKRESAVKSRNLGGD